MNLATKYLNPQNDFAFKKIFGEPKNEKILITMLNAVLKSHLHKPIQGVTFLKTNQDPDISSQKQSLIDVLCQDKDGCQYIIEMQIASVGGFEKRAQYYAARAFSSQMKKGGLYENLKQVIFLAFTNFNLFPTKKDYKSNHKTFDEKTLKHDLKEMCFTFVELPKFIKQCKKPLNELTLEEKFYYFLAYAPDMTPEEVKKFVARDKIMKSAFEVLEAFYWDNEDILLYEQATKRDLDYHAQLKYAQDTGIKKGIKKGREEGLKEGEKKGREEGLKEGEKKGRQALADDLIKAGVSKELIDSLLQSKE